jgi:hypothetical protein
LLLADTRVAIHLDADQKFDMGGRTHRVFSSLGTPDQFLATSSRPAFSLSMQFSTVHPGLPISIAALQVGRT